MTDKTLVCATALENFAVGDVLSRPSHIAAYFMEILNGVLESGETTLTAPEINATFNKTDVAGLSPEQAETKYVEALIAREKGEDDENEAPPITREAATARKHSAVELGSILNGAYDKDLVSILDAGDLVKKGPIKISDACAAKWPIETMVDMPLFGSKATAKPTEEQKLRESNMVFDHYTVDTIGGDKLRGSWYGDIVLSTKEGARLAGEIAELEAETDKAKDAGGIKESLKDKRNRLNRAIALTGKGVMFNVILHRMKKAFPKWNVEVQRDTDTNEPLSTLYPVYIEQRGAMSSRKALTLSQLLSLFRKDKDGFDGIERTIAKGGTVKAFLDYGLQKKKKEIGAGIKIGTVDDCYNTLFALQVYLDGGGDGALSRLVKGPRGQDWRTKIGDLYTTIAPIYNMIADQYIADSTAPTPRPAIVDKVQDAKRRAG